MQADPPLNAAAKTGRPALVTLDGSFPLAALLQLATFCVAMAALIDGNRLTELMEFAPDQFATVPGAVMGAMAIGGLLGCCVGLGQLRRWRSAAAGAALGALCGAAILAV